MSGESGFFNLPRKWISSKGKVMDGSTSVVSAQPTDTSFVVPPMLKSFAATGTSEPLINEKDQRIQAYWDTETTIYDRMSYRMWGFGRCTSVKFKNDWARLHNEIATEKTEKLIKQYEKELATLTKRSEKLQGEYEAAMRDLRSARTMRNPDKMTQAQNRMEMLVKERKQCNVWHQAAMKSLGLHRTHKQYLENKRNRIFTNESIGEINEYIKEMNIIGYKRYESINVKGEQEKMTAYFSADLPDVENQMEMQAELDGGIEGISLQMAAQESIMAQSGGAGTGKRDPLDVQLDLDLVNCIRVADGKTPFTELPENYTVLNKVKAAQRKVEQQEATKQEAVEEEEDDADDDRKALIASVPFEMPPSAAPSSLARDGTSDTEIL